MTGDPMAGAGPKLCGRHHCAAPGCGKCLLQARWVRRKVWHRKKYLSRRLTGRK